MTEQLPYRVLRSAAEFELRQYDDYCVVTSRQSGSFAEASNRAFGTLVQFISGNNDRNERMAMTAPVLQQERGPDQHDISFVLPAAVAVAPEPRSAAVQVRRVSGHTAAARRFSGIWTERRARAELARLRQALQDAGLPAVGEVAFARFDPPWKPGFLRRNEVLVTIPANLLG